MNDNAWRRIEDELPESGVPVLVYHAKHGVGMAFRGTLAGGDVVYYTIYGDARGYYRDVTHWRPLPAPPTDEATA